MPSRRISVHWPSYQNGGSIYYDIIVCKYKPCQKHGYNGNQASNNYHLHILVVESSPGTDFIRQVLTRPGNAVSFLAHGQCWFGVERVLQIAHHNPTALQSNLSREQRHLKDPLIVVLFRGRSKNHMFNASAGISPILADAFALDQHITWTFLKSISRLQQFH